MVKISDLSRNTRSGKRNALWSSDLINYQYTVANRSYESRIWKVGFDGIPSDLRLKYTSAFYNPLNPEQSCLEKGWFFKGSLFKLALGFIMFIPIFGFSYDSYKKRGIIKLNKIVKSWPKRTEVSKLVINSEAKVNDISFGASVTDLSKFGKPDELNEDSLFYKKFSVNLELSESHFSGVSINITEAKQPPRLLLQNIEIGPNFNAIEAKRRLGTPIREEHDEEEIIMTFHKDQIETLFEFEKSSKKLKFFATYPIK